MNRKAFGARFFYWPYFNKKKLQIIPTAKLFLNRNMPCPSMWPKQFWSVQNGLVWPNWFGLDHNDLISTKMKWSRPKWTGQVQIGPHIDDFLINNYPLCKRVEKSWLGKKTWHQFNWYIIWASRWSKARNILDLWYHSHFEKYQKPSDGHWYCFTWWYIN